MYFSAQLKRFVDRDMLDYCEQNEQCQRDKLFNDFDKYTHSPENIGYKFVKHSVHVVAVLWMQMTYYFKFVLMS